MCMCVCLCTRKTHTCLSTLRRHLWKRKLAEMRNSFVTFSGILLSRRNEKKKNENRKVCAVNVLLTRRVSNSFQLSSARLSVCTLCGCVFVLVCGLWRLFSPFRPFIFIYRNIILRSREEVVQFSLGLSSFALTLAIIFFALLFIVLRFVLPLMTVYL